MGSLGGGGGGGGGGEPKGVGSLWGDGSMGWVGL